MSKRKTSSGRWTEDQARKVLKEWQQSGESVARFAKRRGLVPERLYRWRRDLEGRDKRASGRRRGSKTEGMRLAEVSAVKGARSYVAEQERLEVMLGNGRRIWVPNGFCAAEMAKLIAVLEEAPC